MATSTKAPKAQKLLAALPTALVEVKAEAMPALDRDLVRAAGLAGLTLDEVRFVVEEYYRVQNERIRVNNQIRKMKEHGEPHTVISWMADTAEKREANIQKALGAWAVLRPAGKWLQSQYGIGPVLSAGLLAYIDINKAPTVGHIWRFAGLDPTMRWLGRKASSEVVSAILGGDDSALEEFGEDGQFSETETAEIAALLADVKQGKREITGEHFAKLSRVTGRSPGKLISMARDEKGVMSAAKLERELAKRPWSADLKRLCWLIGQCVMKTCNIPESFYGRLYKERKLQEVANNSLGKFAEQAKKVLREKKFKDAEYRAIYESGKLPDGHIDARARRWMVKIFLAHTHQAMYLEAFKKMPPKPYIIEHGGHTHEIKFHDPEGVFTETMAKLAAGS